MSTTSAEDRLVRTAWGAVTETGAVRAVNEDSFIAAFPVFAVADGMGGHEAGDRASAEVVDVLGRLVGLPSAGVRGVMASLRDAQRRVEAIEAPPGRDAGATVSGVVVAEEGGVPYWLVVNLGDSRTYRMSGGRLVQISVDHSEVQEMVEAGTLTRQQAERHPRRHVVTRAVGAGVGLDPDFWMLPIAENDRILVCSDGLTGEVSDARIAELLLAQPDPQSAARSLVDAALEAGGHDNVTVVVIDAHDVVGAAPDEATAQDMVDDDEDTVPRIRVLELGEQA